MPRLQIPRPFALALGAMLFVSCVDPLGMCGCPPTLYTAVLYGRVTDPFGVPVAGARVRAEHGAAGCQPQGWELGWATTDANGRYRAELDTPGALMECMYAFALSPAGSTLLPSDTVPFQVRFASSRPEDSVRVDLVLRNP